MERNHHVLKWKMQLIMIRISTMNYMSLILTATEKTVLIAIYRKVLTAEFRLHSKNFNEWDSSTLKRPIVACWLVFMSSGEYKIIAYESLAYLNCIMHFGVSVILKPFVKPGKIFGEMSPDRTLQYPEIPDTDKLSFDFSLNLA